MMGVGGSPFNGNVVLLTDRDEFLAHEHGVVVNAYSLDGASESPGLGNESPP